MATITATPTFIVKGKSGKPYAFYIFSWPTSFNKAGGLYFFIKMNGQTIQAYIYLGITNDLSGRFDNHHKMDCIKKNGATHIGAYIDENEQSRLNAEADILAEIKTSCNDQ